MPLSYSDDYREALQAVLPQFQKQTATLASLQPGDITSRREATNQIWGILMKNQPSVDNIRRSLQYVKAADGYSIPVHRFQDKYNMTDSPQPAVIYTHGGGFIALSVDLYAPLLENYVRQSGVQIFAMDYRLSPEHPFPTPVEDCYTVLEWVSSHARELGVSPSRLAIMGDSAGGGLSASIAVMSRDRHLNPPLKMQLLLAAFLDDQNTKPGSHAQLDGLGTWTVNDNIAKWKAYLGESTGGPDMPAHAAASRVNDVEGLPSLYLDVPDLDILRNEGLEYAGRIARAGIGAEIHLYPGVPHSFEAFAPNIPLARAAISNRVRALKTL